MGFIIKLLLTGLFAFFIAYVVPGIELRTLTDGFLLAVVLALLNTFVRPILVMLTIPITFLTLGLFLLVINVIIVYLADWILGGFDIHNFISAIIFSLALSLISAIISFMTR